MKQDRIEKCCFVGCNKQAVFEITSCRFNRQPAGPDPYSDNTLACEDHVGPLLGWQVDAVNTDEIEWKVTQWEAEANSTPSTVSIIGERS